MQLSRQMMASGTLVVLIAGVALGAIALRGSDARAARPAITYSVETPATWRVTEVVGANGREAPGFAADIVHRFAFGETVEATGRLAQVQRETWRQVTRDDGKPVWVLAPYLGPIGSTPPTTAPPVTTPPVTTPPVTTPPTTPPPTTPPPPAPIFDTENPGLWQVARVAAGERLNVRAAPGTGSPVVARLDHDATAIRSTGTIARLEGALWRQVEYRAGATGWVHASFLDRYVTPAPKPVFDTEKPGDWDVTGVAAGGFLNVRSRPGIEHPVVFRFAHDTVAVPATGRIATLSGTVWREVQWADAGQRGWVSARFLRPHVTPPPPPPPPPAPRGTIVMGDWLGDGVQTPAIFRDGVWHLRFSNSSGQPDLIFSFGEPGDRPVAGDWDGNGTDTPGVVRGATWHIRNANSSGPADATFTFGNPGDTPVAGDWDGDGIDTPGVVRDATWHLRNANSQGPADIVFAYGDRGDTPVVGDWDGDGRDSPGVVRGNRWLLRHAASAGPADVELTFGDPSDTPLAGDWDGDGVDTPGVVRGAAVHLRDRLSSGVADVTYSYELPAR